MEGNQLSLIYLHTRPSNLLRGAKSREFRGFLVQTILKLDEGNLTHAELYLNLQRVNKPRP